MFWEKEIAKQFNLQLESISPTRGVYLIKTNKGTKCLKRLNYGVQKLLFIYGAKEHLIKNGFPNVDRYMLACDGNPYVEYGDDLYVITEWIDGRECNFRDAHETKKAASAMAKLHEASKGYEVIDGAKLKSDLGRWHHLMVKRRDGLKKMKSMAEGKLDKSEFDRLFIEHVELYVGIANEAIDTLERSKYDDVVKDTLLKKSFCHHDYTYHNIIFDKKDELHVIDFDYCKYEIRAYDIASFLIKVLKRNDWNFDICIDLMNEYDNASTISDEEYMVILAFLKFPQRLWRLANRYYYNESNWPDHTFLRKIREIIEEKDPFIDFVGQFEDKYVR
ncbi:spore coat protein S [Oxobacter pfennigii]|uniref:Spore coat protein S n=1 Tax=Oxobacter pfennigii TaxID=36849 RepID=A0A0P8W7C9_9CLOT|nr:CotS family spore coat protein [Oxobacter pfennigii]KPU44564.1 spore coat protein S [Oxobacter pfennigii]